MKDDTKLDPINWRELLRGTTIAAMVVALCLYYYRDTSPTQKPEKPKQNTTEKGNDSIVRNSAQNTIQYYDTARISFDRHMDSVTKPQRK